MKRQITLLLLSFIFTFNACEHQAQTPVITIPDGKMGMIGYGSLSSLESIEEVLGREYQDSIYYVHLDGYQRVWGYAGANDDPNLPAELLKYDSFYIKNGDTLPFDKTVFLNIVEHRDVQLNCVLYFVTPEEIALFDVLEMGYQRIDVTDNVREFNFENGKVFAYKALPEYEYDPGRDHAISKIEKSYLELVLAAYDAKGRAYRKEFDKSTIPHDTAQVAPVIRVKTRE